MREGWRQGDLPEAGKCRVQEWEEGVGEPESVLTAEGGRVEGELVTVLLSTQPPFQRAMADGSGTTEDAHLGPRGQLSLPEPRSGPKDLVLPASARCLSEPAGDLTADG